MRMLSGRQKEILDFIADFIENKGYAPSVRDVVKGCGISSSSVAQYHLNVLERAGFIRRDREVSRSIALVRSPADLVPVPILGTIAAGQPIPVPPDNAWVTPPEDALRLPEELTRGLDGVYALRVKGTSMIDALVDDGDIVLMQQASSADNGEMVAVWLKNQQEVTLKKIYFQRGRVCLKPANPLMEPIYERPDNVDVQGKVIGVIRLV